MKMILLIAMLLHQSVFAQVLPGLDLTFATNGLFIINDTGTYGRLILRPNNHIIVGGVQIKNGQPAKLVEFNPNGTINNNFAQSGYFFPFTFPRQPYPAYPALGVSCLQQDGKILLGGQVDTVSYPNTFHMWNPDFLLMRLDSNGSMDSSFNGCGYVITSYHPYHPLGNSNDRITSIAMQSDGKIVVLGNSNVDTMMVLRYQANGSLDSSFGINGKAKLMSTAIEYPDANDVSVLPDGRIVVGATTKIKAIGKYCFTALKLMPDGSLDTSFNHTGMAYADVGGWLAYCKAMRVQPDGKILVSGYSDSITVVRFDTTGTLDAGFGNGGMIKLPQSTGGTALTLQPDGKILVNGDADINFVVFRLNADGSRDMGFGLNGSINQQVLNKKNSANDIAVQADGKIIVSGSASDSTSNYTKPFLLRYLPNAASVEELPENKRHFKLYPNPVKDRLIVSYMNNKEVIANISVYDIAEKKIASKIKQFYKNSFVTIDVADLTTGIYFIYIANDKGLNERFKFVKQ